MSETTADAPSIDVLHSFTLADVSREHRRSFPQQVAVIDGELRLTWPRLDDRVNRLANALSSAGVGPGDVILWLAQNSHGILECLLAAAKTGAVCCVANWRQSADEFAFVIDDAAAKMVIWQETEVGGAVRAARAASSTGESARWLQLEADPADATADSYTDFVASGSPDDPARPIDPAAPVLMLYTAAFLGTPNGAMLSHHAVMTQSLLMANLQRIDLEYVYLNSGPLFHVATFMTTLATLLMGGTNVFTPRVDAAELLPFAPLGRIVKSAAENIYPAEVEAALQSHPAVREAAVIGIPDATWGQAVRAIVVLEDDGSATEDDLVAHVRERIASYKKPRSVLFRNDPLPRNGWPIDYDALDAEYGGGGYRGGG